MKSEEKTLKAILLFLFAALPCRGNQQVSLIGPRFITSGDTYKALLDVSEMDEKSKLIVALRSKSGFLDVQKFNGKDNTEFNKEVKFQLPENLHDSYKLMALMVKEKNGRNVCLRKEISIFTAIKQSYITLIQTDKPIYKPGERMRFQVLVLDHQTKPFEYKSLNVDVLNNKGLVVRTFNNPYRQDFSYYQDSFKIPDEQSSGNWTLQVKINGDDRKSSKSFIVKDFKAPPFQVFIQTTPRVSMDQHLPSIELSVSAKYPFGTMVKGRAEVKVTIADDDEIYYSDVLGHNNGNKTLSLRDDLGLNFLGEKKTLVFHVKYIENRSNKFVEQKQYTEVLPKGRHYMDIKKPKFFKPGFTYKIDVIVLTLNGELEKSTTFPLQMTLKYTHKSGKQMGTVLESAYLKNGTASFILNPEREAVSFEVELKYDKAEVKDVVTADYTKLFSNDAEIVEVTYEPKKFKLGSKLNISVQSNALMQTLNVVVISNSGLIFSRQFKEAAVQKKFWFELEVIPEMVPEANVVIFYIREQDGLVVFDQFKIELGYVSTNYLTIFPNSDTLAPKEISTFSLKTMPNSLIGLLGVDQTIRYLGNNNEITSKEVNGKLSVKPNITSDFPLSDFAFLQLSQGTLQKCTYFEEQFLGGETSNRVSVGAAGEMFETLPFDEEMLETFEAINPTEDMLRKYFPDVWIYETFYAENQISTFSQIIPDTITTWMVGGFSINKDHGLAIADPAQVKVFQNFFVKLEVPNVVKVDEVFKVDLNIFNFLPTDQNVGITLTIDQKELEVVQETQIQGKPKGCVEYTQTPILTKNLKIVKDSSENHIFFVRALKTGNLRIKVGAAGQGVTDEVEKVVKVDFVGEKQFRSSSMLIELSKKNPKFTQNISLDLQSEVEPNTVKIEATISGNLLGPSLENLDRFILMPEGCGEQKLKSFASAIYAYKYLKSLKLANATLTENAFESIKHGYEDIKKRQSLSGGFKLWNKKQGNVDGVWLTAYVAQLLGDASEIIEIDEQVIKRALHFLARNRKESGKFDDNDSENPRLVQGNPTNRAPYMTAFVMIAFGKNRRYDEFKPTVISSINFLNTSGGADYEYAIAAYAMIINDRIEEGKAMLDKVKWNFLKLPQIKALQVEIASYVILACQKVDCGPKTRQSFEWLIKQRKAGGGFFSTHDTVLALQALSAMNEKLKNEDVDIIITFKGQKWTKVESIQSFSDIKYVELPTKEGTFTVSASGNGFAYVNVFSEFKRKPNKKNMILTKKSISITENEAKMKFDFKGYNSNMAVFEIEMPSGYEYETFSAIDGLVENAETNEDKSRAFLYLGSVTKDLQSIEVEAIKTYDVKEMKNSVVKVYDYYEPDERKAVFNYNLNHELICNSNTIEPSNGAARSNN